MVSSPSQDRTPKGRGAALLSISPHEVLAASPRGHSRSQPIQSAAVAWPFRNLFSRRPLAGLTFVRGILVGLRFAIPPLVLPCISISRRFDRRC